MKHLGLNRKTGENNHNTIGKKQWQDMGGGKPWIKTKHTWIYKQGMKCRSSNVCAGSRNTHQQGKFMTIIDISNFIIVLFTLHLNSDNYIFLIYARIHKVEWYPKENTCAHITNPNAEVFLSLYYYIFKAINKMVTPSLEFCRLHHVNENSLQETSCVFFPLDMSCGYAICQNLSWASLLKTSQHWTTFTTR